MKWKGISIGRKNSTGGGGAINSLVCHFRQLENILQKHFCISILTQTVRKIGDHCTNLHNLNIFSFTMSYKCPLCPHTYTHTHTHTDTSAQIPVNSWVRFPMDQKTRQFAYFLHTGKVPANIGHNVSPFKSKTKEGSKFAKFRWTPLLLWAAKENQPQKQGKGISMK